MPSTICNQWMCDERGRDRHVGREYVVCEGVIGDGEHAEGVADREERPGKRAVLRGVGVDELERGDGGAQAGKDGEVERVLRQRWLIVDGDPEAERSEA